MAAEHLPAQRERQPHWLIVFTSGDSSWSHQCTGTYTEADRYASSLCYQVSTRYRIHRYGSERTP